MRVIVAVLAFAITLAGVSASHAERRMFIIQNNDDGAYGIDRCLATGAACGAAIARSYCRTHDFKQAVSYRKVDKSDITGAVPANVSNACRGKGCDEYLAIECSR